MSLEWKGGALITKPLEKEYEYYLGICEELAKEHEGEFVAIKGQEVLGIFADYKETAKAVYVRHEYGTVLIQELGRDWEYLPTMVYVPEFE